MSACKTPAAQQVSQLCRCHPRREDAAAISTSARGAARRNYTVRHRSRRENNVRKRSVSLPGRFALLSSSVGRLGLVTRGRGRGSVDKGKCKELWLDWDTSRLSLRGSSAGQALSLSPPVAMGHDTPYFPYQNITHTVQA